MSMLCRNSVFVWIIVIQIADWALASQKIEKKIFCMHLSTSIQRTREGNFRVEYIDESLCTHMIYGYVGITENGTITSLNKVLDFDKGNIRKFNNKKHYNRELKTLVAVGGWEASESSEKYSNVLRDTDHQNEFVMSALGFVTYHKFDGVALHWAYPGVNGGDPLEDKFTFDRLLGKLKAEFAKRNLLVMAICHGLTHEMGESYNVDVVSRTVDYVLLTAYDFYGHWSDHIGLASALYPHPQINDVERTANSVVSNWLERGASAEKLVLGVPLFGKMFTLKYENQTEPGALFSGMRKSKYINHPGIISYLELCESFAKEAWTLKWEDTQKAAYAYKGEQWVSYENERSLEIKSQYIQSKNLAGVGVAFIEDDDFRGSCDEKYKLVKLLNEYLRGGTEYEYILNVSVFKKSHRDGLTQCVYQSSSVIDVT